MKVNTYNFVEKGCVFYHAIATSEEHAIQLAEEKGFDIEGMEVELERMNVRDELGRPYESKIEDAMNMDSSNEFMSKRILGKCL